MHRENLFEKTEQLKSLFKDFFQHKKKVAALENYAQMAGTDYKSELQLIKSCLKTRFLSKKGADFLEELIDEHHVNYLDWSHRTKWVKSQIAEQQLKADPIQQIFFDFRPDVYTPAQLIARPAQRQLVRA
jgi:hypothetical protein